jgi:hypothetical protein
MTIPSLVALGSDLSASRAMRYRQLPPNLAKARHISADGITREDLGQHAGQMSLEGSQLGDFAVEHSLLPHPLPATRDYLTVGQ